MFTTCAMRAPAADHGGGIAASNGATTVTVDIHCHVITPAAHEATGNLPTAESGAPGTVASERTQDINRQNAVDILEMGTSVERRLSEMDKMGVDIQAISTSPQHYYYWTDPELGRQTSRLVNDNIAEITANHPERFVGLGTLPMQNTEMALAELERCIRELGMRGVEIGTNVNGEDFSNPRFESFFARAAELDIVVFIHPFGYSESARFAEYYFTNVLGNPLDSTIAVGHLIFGGVLERYPGLKLVVAHGGGYLPAYSGRLDHAYAVRPECRDHISRPPSEYLKMLYFDTMVFDPDQIAYLVQKYGADHVLLGTDYPYDMGDYDPLATIAGAAGLSDDERARIGGLNAAKLLKLDV